MRSRLCSVLAEKHQESMNCIIFYLLHIHISQTFTLNLLSLESRRSCSFFIPQKREPSLKSLFHSQHQHSQWLTSAVWEPSFSAFLGEIRQLLGQTALLDTVASNKVIFNGICLLGRTGFQTDRKLHRSKDCIWRASKSQIVLRNPVHMWGFFQGDNRCCSLQTLHFKEWRRNIFYVFISYLIFF